MYQGSKFLCGAPMQSRLTWLASLYHMFADMAMCNLKSQQRSTCQGQPEKTKLVSEVGSIRAIC